MIRLTVDGTGGFDGVFDLDLEALPLTNRELHWIKDIAGVRLGEFEKAADAGDNDLLVAFTAIALVRSGRIPRTEVKRITDILWDIPGGRILAEEVNLDDEGDALPPVSEGEQTSLNGSSESPQSSSDSSSDTGETPQETGLVSTGDPS